MSIFRRFLRQEDGIALPLFLVAMPVFIGLSLLVIDIGRGNNLKLDLQKAVDALALAAAAELDGTETSIARADAALAAMLANRSRFSDGGEVTINLANANITRRYLWTLPPNDDDPITSAYETVVPVEAEFVEVTATPQDYSPLFPINAVMAAEDIPISAVAVAGYGSAVCDFTPMFICNPFEDPLGGDTAEPTIYDLIDGTISPAPLLTLRQQGGQQGQAFPGNFGFLESNIGPGANALREAFARVNPPECFARNRVTTKPGFSATVTDALNVRFDIFDGPMNGVKGNSEYRPARNVRKGYGPKSADGGGNPCNYEPAADASQFMGLPRDDCVSLPGCADTQGGEIGNGMWDLQAYWDTNFPGTPFPAEWDVANPPSRYDVYRYEIDNGLTPNESLGLDGLPGGGDGEIGSPQCYSRTSDTLSDDPDRRFVYGAIINCVEQGLTTNAAGGKQTVRAIAFGSFFITEALEKGGGGPSGERDDQSIRVELVDLTGPDGNGSLEQFERNDPQLYR